MGKYNLIKSIPLPCCNKNAWCHKMCLQTYAQTSGYFLKCPLCNDSDNFREWIAQRGVFIPDRWDCNAFSAIWRFFISINNYFTGMPNGRSMKQDRILSTDLNRWATIYDKIEAPNSSQSQFDNKLGYFISAQWKTIKMCCKSVQMFERSKLSGRFGKQSLFTSMLSLLWISRCSSRLLGCRRIPMRWLWSCPESQTRKCCQLLNNKCQQFNSRS